MKGTALLATALFALSFTATAHAVGAGKVIEFTGSPQGVVVFDGQAHKNAGITCGDCHNPAVFPKMKKGTVKITMSDLYAGKYCGKCHDGKKAFKIADNCVRCHRDKKKAVGANEETKGK
jgi:c(7)-type cytochrome triheme protein